MKVNARNAAAIRRKTEAETPLYLHKKGEYVHRWNAWNPNAGAMMEQTIIIEKWDICTTAPRADGKMEVTTANRRLEHQLAELHRARPQECSAGRKTLNVTTYTIDAEVWREWLAEHTEEKDHEQVRKAL